jgi:putative DNA primase/helicase
MSDASNDPMVIDALTLARICSMSPMEYDRVRKSEAARLSVRAETLDKERSSKLRLVPRMSDGIELTEDSVALAFVDEFQHRLRFCHTTGAWYEWTGTVWRRDKVKKSANWSREKCRAVVKASGAEDEDLARLGRAAFSAAVETFARMDQRVAVISELWDKDPWMIGTPTGTLDLRNGSVYEARQDDHITKLTGCDVGINSHCPLWLKFLHEATAGNNDLIRFIQQWCGYTLTGVTSEHALLFVYGPGGNGKSVFLNVLNMIMGEYAKTAPMDSFTASVGGKHPTDMAGMKGARLVTASETEDGQAWAEARIKSLTGGDIISARFMRQDFFEFRPEFKLTIVGNHKPVFRNVDDAMRRRINIVPFTQKPEAPDRELETKLQAELPAILRWMVEGCLDWQKNGLVRPQVVKAATDTYFADQDLVGHWVEECCVRGKYESETMAELFKSWSAFSIANGEKPGTTKWFSQTLARLGASPVKNTPGNHGKRGFEGISVRRDAAVAHSESEKNSEGWV